MVTELSVAFAAMADDRFSIGIAVSGWGRFSAFQPHHHLAAASTRGPPLSLHCLALHCCCKICKICKTCIAKYKMEWEPGPAWKKFTARQNWHQTLLHLPFKNTKCLTAKLIFKKNFYIWVGWLVGWLDFECFDSNSELWFSFKLSVDLVRIEYMPILFPSLE